MKDGIVITSLHFVCIDVYTMITQTISLPIDNGELTGNYGYVTTTQTTVVTLASACFWITVTEDYGLGNGDGGDGGNNLSGVAGSDSGGIQDNTGNTIITGAIIDDTVPQSSSILPIGWYVRNYENNLTEEARQIYFLHPELRQYLEINNCDFSSRLFINDMIALLQSEDYNEEQKNAIIQLILLCSNNHASFSLENDFNQNQMEIAEVENLLENNDYPNNQFEIEEFPAISNGFIGRCKIKLNPFYGIRISMNFNTLSNGQYSLSTNNVSSDLYGVSAFTEWTQLNSQSRVNNDFNGKIRLELYGKLKQQYTIPPLSGISINQYIRIIIIIDKNTGEIISTEWYYD